MAQIVIKGLVTDLRRADQVMVGSLAHDSQGNIFMSVGPNKTTGHPPVGWVNLQTGLAFPCAALLMPLPDGAEVTLTNSVSSSLLTALAACTDDKRRHPAKIENVKQRIRAEIKGQPVGTVIHAHSLRATLGGDSNLLHRAMRELVKEGALTHTNAGTHRMRYAVGENNA